MDVSAAVAIPDGAALSQAPSANLADAFSALLAEELGEVPPSPTWGRVVIGGKEQALEAADGPSPLTVTDALVDEVTRRVAERLGENAVRDLVSRHVVEVAERLVREEIERIKAGA
jgi:uncharacterized protein YcbX